MCRAVDVAAVFHGRGNPDNPLQRPARLARLASSHSYVGSIRISHAKALGGNGRGIGAKGWKNGVLECWSNGKVRLRPVRFELLCGYSSSVPVIRSHSRYPRNPRWFLSFLPHFVLIRVLSWAVRSGWGVEHWSIGVVENWSGEGREDRTQDTERRMRSQILDSECCVLNSTLEPETRARWARLHIRILDAAAEHLAQFPE